MRKLQIRTTAIIAMKKKNCHHLYKEVVRNNRVMSSRSHPRWPWDDSCQRYKKDECHSLKDSNWWWFRCYALITGWKSVWTRIQRRDTQWKWGTQSTKRNVATNNKIWFTIIKHFHALDYCTIILPMTLGWYYDDITMILRYLACVCE